MSKNLILDDLRKTRERLLAEAGGTLDGLVDQLQRDERRSDREIVCSMARSDQCTETSKPNVSATDNRASSHQ